MSETAAPATTPTDVDALRRFLDGEHRVVRERARATLSRPEFAPVASLPTDEYRARVTAWTQTLADEGLTARGFPSEYGGADGIGESVALFETVAHADLSLLVKIGVQFGLFGGAVLHLGSRAHHEGYLRDIATFALPGCFAMTETGHGSDVGSIGTTATYDPDAHEFVVHTPHEAARKDYIGNAARDGRLAVVFAQLVVGGEERGVHALLVPIRDAPGRPSAGVEIEDCGEKVGLNGVDNGRLRFDRVRVPREALLDRFARVTPAGEYVSEIENPARRFFTMLGTLVQGRVSVGGASVSAAKTALTIAVRYALARRQFELPDGDTEALLLDYRTHQRRLLPALARTYALHFAQEELVATLHEVFSRDGNPERERRELETRAAGLKAVESWHATDTIQACREACGGAGYLSVNRFGALRADTDVFTTFEGDNTVLMQLVAKSLLTDYKEDFGALDPLGTLGFVAGQLVGVLIERTAAREFLGRLRDEVARGGDDDADVLARDAQLALFRWREMHVLESAARRIKETTDAGDDPFDALVEVQDHVITAARAHLDRVVLEAFVDAIARCNEPGVAALLDRVCDLHALSTVERERGWYQEHGRLSSTRSKAVIQAVNRLCADLRADAGTLVDAFGIPDAILAAPIAVGAGSRPPDA